MNITDKAGDIELERVNLTSENTLTSDMTQDDDDDNGKRKEMSWMDRMDQENSKTVCCMKVRGQSVGYLNLLAFYLAVCSSVLSAFYQSGSSTYVQELTYKVSYQRDLTQRSYLSVPTNAINLIIILASGFIFDTYGRRKPLAFFYFCCVIGWAIYSLGWGSSDQTLWEGYFISSILILMPIQLIPYIPDLIQEESQRVASTFQGVAASIIATIVPQMTVLPHKYFRTICIIFCVGNIIIGPFVVYYTKNIIGSKEHISREITSQHSTKKGMMLKKSFQQALKVIFGKPMVLIAMLACVISGPVVGSSAGNLTFCIEQHFHNNQAHGISAAKQYQEDANTISSSIMIPMNLLIGLVLMKYVNHFNLLIIINIITFVSAVGAILTIQDVYKNEHLGMFTVFNIISQVTDNQNSFVGQVMIYNHLELESRGTVLALQSVFTSIVSTLMTLLVGQLSKMYLIPGTQQPDYIKGTKLVMTIGYSVLGVFLVAIIIYKCILIGRKGRE